MNREDSIIDEQIAYFTLNVIPTYTVCIKDKESNWLSSGVFLLGERGYDTIITAAHVIDDTDNKNFFIFQKDGFYEEVDRSKWVYIKHNNSDIGCIVIPSEYRINNRITGCINENLSRSILDLNHDATYFFHGFPEISQRSLWRSQMEITDVTFTSMYMETRNGSYSDQEYNGKHYIFDFKKEITSRHLNQEVNFRENRNPRGLSGCGVWVIEKTNSTIINPSIIKLIGIQSCWVPKKLQLKVVPIEEIISIIEGIHQSSSVQVKEF